jgi:hypothetical protein
MGNPMGHPHVLHASTTGYALGSPSFRFLSLSQRSTCYALTQSVHTMPLRAAAQWPTGGGGPVVPSIWEPLCGPSFHIPPSIGPQNGRLNAVLHGITVTVRSTGRAQRLPVIRMHRSASMSHSGATGGWGPSALFIWKGLHANAHPRVSPRAGWQGPSRAMDLLGSFLRIAGSMSHSGPPGSR